MSVIFQSVSAVQSEEIVHGCNYSAWAADKFTVAQGSGQGCPVTDCYQQPCHKCHRNFRTDTYFSFSFFCTTRLLQVYTHCQNGTWATKLLALI